MPTGTAEGARGFVRGLGLVATIALVAGNIVGSGIYTTPASLAETAGPLSLVGWLIVALGFLCLSAVYGDLASAYPVAGGLQIYTQRAFGRLVGLETAFLYWVSCVTGGAAFVTVFVGYLRVFLPNLESSLASFLVAQALLWTMMGINILGVRVGAAVQVVTTVLKILPLLVLAVALLPAASVSNLQPFAPKGFGALFPALSMIAWVFLGAETVTVPAEEIRDARRTIRKAAYAGFLLATAVYILVAGALGLAFPSHVIAGTTSPLALAARGTLGPSGEALVTIGALVSTAGILNGWLLITGRLPFAASRAGIAPRWLGGLHPRFGTPVAGLVVSTLPASILVLLYFNRTLLQAYNVVTLASTATALIAIGTACVAYMVLMRREPERFTDAARRRGPAVATIGLLIAAVMVAGSGWKVLGLTALVMALPLPFYVLRRHRAQDTTAD